MAFKPQEAPSLRHATHGVGQRADLSLLLSDCQATEPTKTFVLVVDGSVVCLELALIHNTMPRFFSDSQRDRGLVLSAGRRRTFGVLLEPSNFSELLSSPG